VQFTEKRILRARVLENRILRARVLERLVATDQEKRRLLRWGRKLSLQRKERISIVN
jgi:hypothetical protein